MKNELRLPDVGAGLAPALFRHLVTLPGGRKGRPYDRRTVTR
jgi:hypothetical protein